jgi:Flp pilus assembly protein TadD
MPRLARRDLRWIVPALLVLALGGAIAARAWPWADPDRLWSEALADFEAHRWDQSAAKLARLARLRDPTPEDWLLRAKLALARAQDDEALADLARVPDAHPMAAQARAVTGQVEIRRGHARAAEAAFRRALELDPGQVSALRGLIYIYGFQLRRQELADAFRTLQDLAPLICKDALLWCSSRLMEWEPTEVVQEMRRYLAADHDDRPSRLALAEALRRLNRPAEAEAALKPLPASDLDARLLLVRLALDRGDLRTAESHLADGPADDPDLDRLRGRLALARHDAAEAVHQFRIAYEADPEHRETLSGLGLALRTAGDPSATTYLEAAARYDALAQLLERVSREGGCDDVALLRRLGAACEAIGRRPEARAWYGLALARDPLDPDAQRALYRLDHPETAPTRR